VSFTEQLIIAAVFFNASAMLLTAAVIVLVALQERCPGKRTRAGRTHTSKDAKPD